jgi:hypothetical protein
MTGNSTPNFVKVKHKDGTVAEYLHGLQGGVVGVNAPLRAAGYTASGTGPSAEYNNTSNPVYVQAGQILCLAGNVGISMFPHIHFCVASAVGSSDYRAVTFDDEDVESHEGRCWSMRKYESDNSNKGGVAVPPSVPDVANYP